MFIGLGVTFAVCAFVYRALDSRNFRYYCAWCAMVTLIFVGLTLAEILGLINIMFVYRLVPFGFMAFAFPTYKKINPEAMPIYITWCIFNSVVWWIFLFTYENRFCITIHLAQ